jgi:hypothetical protein
MRRVRRHSALVLAILLYVALDLSCAAMPGAFVFDATESIDAAQGRVRVAPERVVLAMSMRSPAVLDPVLERPEPPRPPARADRERHPLACRLCLPRQDQSKPTEDPH